MQELIQQYVAIWNDKNISNLQNVFMSHSEYWDAIQQGNAIELLNNSISTTHAAFPDVRLKITSLNHTTENRFFLEWVMTGTNTGSFFGAEPTGNKVEVKGLDCLSCKANKISEIKSFYDSNSFGAQLGII